MLVMHHHPDNKGRKAPKMLFAHQSVYPRSKVDANSFWGLEWEGVGQAHLMTDMACVGLREGTCFIQCEEGDLVIECEWSDSMTPKRSRVYWSTDACIPDPPYKPETFHIMPHPEPKVDGIKERTTHHYPGHPGASMHYEADETARCIRDGKLESDRMTWEESRIVQGWFDQVRKEGDTVLKNAKGTAGK